MSHDSAGVVMGGRRVAKDGRGMGQGGWIGEIVHPQHLVNLYVSANNYIHRR